MNAEEKTYRIRFNTKLLGTVPKNQDVYATHIATKAPKIEQTDEEIETVKEVDVTGWTGFHENGDGIFIYSYMILGFLKSSLGVLMENGAVKKVPAYKKWMDSLVFVHPRRILFGMKEPDGHKERPLRGMTPKGPRVTVVRSDFVKEGREIEFIIEVLNNGKGIDMKLIDKLFEYGEYQGLGQWRGSGRYGQFVVTKG